MIGLYLKEKQPGEQHELLAVLAEATGTSASALEAAPRRLMLPNSSVMSGDSDAGNEFSQLFPYPEGALASVAVSPAVRVFADNFGAALVAQLNRSTRAGGKLLLPTFSDDEARRKGFWSRAWLEKLLGPAAWTSRSGDMALFNQAPREIDVASTLSWYFNDYGKLALDHLAFRRLGVMQDLWNSCSDFLLTKEIPERAVSVKPGFEDVADIGKVLSAFFSSMNYSLGGVGYKALMLRHMLDLYSPGRKGLRVLDMGGGVGFVAAELLMSCDRIARAVTCDLCEMNVPLSRRLFSGCRKQLQNRFFVDIGPAEQFHYDAPYDMVSYLGSLLYVPRNLTQQALDSAWAGLDRGGLLVIHENIKNPAYAKDFDVMFSVEELEGLLGRYGAIEYFMSTATVQLKPEQVGQKSVFRVVRKK